MDPAVRSHIRLLINQLNQAAQGDLREQKVSVYQLFGDGGRLHSDTMIRTAAKEMEKVGREAITGMIDKVGAVEQSPESFAMIRDGFNSFMGLLRDELDDVMKIAIGGIGTPNHRRDMAQAAGMYLQDVSHRLQLQLDLHHLPFIMSRTPIAVAPQEPVEPLAPAPPKQKNPGGRPLGEHWDEMWAEIAVKLWNGELEPDTQADIEREMHDWLAARDLDAGDTTVRARARKLWEKMKALP